MLIGPRRAILIGAIAAIALTIILIPFIFSLTAPNLKLVEVMLSDVTVTEVEENKIELRPVFIITNPTDQTTTTSRIDYELFADDTSLGNHSISFEDIPLNGRPAIFAQGSVSIAQDPRFPFVVEFDDGIADVYTKIRDSPDMVQWSARGEALIESTLVQERVAFERI